MSLPVVHMDVVFLAGILAASLVIGVLIGWIRTRSRVGPSNGGQTHSEAKIILQLMSRADHALDNHITSIQGHLSVLGEELPTDIQRWKVSRDAISQAANQMKRHVDRLRRLYQHSIDRRTVARGVPGLGTGTGTGTGVDTNE